MRRRLVGLGTVVALLAAAATAFALAGGASGGNGNLLMRWDLVSINFATGTGSAGGIDSAKAEDGSKLTLTGQGTFRTNVGNPQNVTGGGTWKTFAPNGAQTGSGEYHVTGFVMFEPAPGTFPLPNDAIGPKANARAGFLVVTVGYSDGSRGTLHVSCHLAGTPDNIFEGITATKGNVGYWNHGLAVAGVDENRTLFHVLRG